MKWPSSLQSWGGGGVGAQAQHYMTPCLQRNVRLTCSQLPPDITIYGQAFGVPALLPHDLVWEGRWEGGQP